MKINTWQLICLSPIMLSCEKAINNGNTDISPHTPDPDLTPKEYKYLIKDTLYRTGFTYGQIPEGDARIIGSLNYGEKAEGTKPYWHISQWNNWNNDLTAAVFTDNSPIFKYETLGGNGIIVNTETGSITLRHNTESEYGHSPQFPTNPNSGQRWPHLLLSKDFSNNELVRLSGKEEIVMTTDFIITQFENKIPPGLETSVHTVQLQQYIGLSNRMSGNGFGEFFWFGLGYFDRRYDFPSLFVGEDWDIFIYVPDMKDILLRKTTINRRQTIEVNILPMIRAAFDLAKNRNYLKNTKWEDLYIGTMNIGWETTGTYNVSVTIDDFNIKYR